MQAIAERAQSGELPCDIRAVISDKAAASGLEAARRLSLSTHTLSAAGYADRAAYDHALAELIAGFAPKLVVLAGFMRILSPAFVQRHAGRLINIHPSLLPKFRGLHTHRRALEAGETVHGSSVHFVTEELDGGPVILQAQVAVEPTDTEATLAARVLAQEHRIYPTVIEWFARGRLELRAGRAWLDRAPLDQPLLITH
jgi:phosphoribosylglycinamide formyltransferase-1